MQLYIKWQMQIFAVLYLGQVLTGFALGWSAPVLPKLRDPEQSPIPDELTEMQASLVGSLLLVGALTGSFVSGLMSNHMGRKPSMLVSGLIALTGHILLAVPNGLAMIFAGRILKGLGNCSIFVINLVYIGEMASTNLRGMLLTATSIFTAIGTLLVYSVGPFVSYHVIVYIGMAMTASYCAGVLLIPESPMYYLIKNDEKSAKQILSDLGRDEDFDEMLSSKNAKENVTASQAWIQIFTVKSNRKALFITLTLLILQQISGVIVVIFFATTIFEIAGSSIEPNIATIIIGVTRVCATCAATYFVERTGRKILLLLSTAVCSLSLAVLGIYFYLDEIVHPSAAKLKWLPLVSLILFFIMYELGFGSIPGTFVGEMYQSNVRSTGSALSLCASVSFGFVSGSVFVSMITALGGHVTFWIYSGICASAFIFTAVFVPETKGKTMTEIKDMLSK